ncbi:hypothetical protein B379_07090 [Anoxybacillus ayderensis G10]|nr:hypothetical protein B379_07090 [Anoxybacillus ayderensis G10]
MSELHLSFNETEEKLIKKMKKGNNDIQIVASNGEESLVCIGSIRVKTSILLLAHITDEHRACYGHIGNRSIQISSKDKNSLVRCIIDRRKREKKKFHVYSEGEFYKYSSQLDDLNVNDKHILFAYIEDNKFAQLTLFNNSIDQKVSELSVRENSLISDLRTLALNYLISNFPDCDQYFRLDGPLS